MITGYFLDAFRAFLGFILTPISSLDDVALTADQTAALSAVNSYYSTANQFFPVDTVLAAFAILVAVETFILLFKLFTWSLKKLPFLK